LGLILSPPRHNYYKYQNFTQRREMETDGGQRGNKQTLTEATEKTLEANEENSE
jgi:hypothetical protein